MPEKGCLMSNFAQTTSCPNNACSLVLLFLACAALLLGAAGGASAFPPPGTASDLTLAWGYNGDGQCTVPAQAQSGIVAIAAGYMYSLALTSGGEVLAWGNNDFGQCTVPAPAQSGITGIAAGGYHSLALTSGGEVLAWGNNGDGECTVPAQAQSGIVAIAAGMFHSLALTSGGEVLAWGYNGDGECTVPAQAQSGIVAIAAGFQHSLALTSGGEVLAWGLNANGQCTVPAPAQSGIVAIAAGGTHSLALTSGGQVLAWGNNGSGQCTVPAPAQSGIVAIAAGSSHSLALTSGGEVLAWGLNANGQCTVPVQAQSGIFAIAAGYHSLALHVADTVSVSLSPPSPATVASGGTTSLSASATDVWDHSLTWSWEDGGAGGLFSPPDSAAPTYTALGNTSDSDVIISLSATATCTEGASDTETTTLTVQPVEHTFSVTANPPNPATVPSGGATALSATFSDSRPAHSVASWSWEDGGAGGGFSPSANEQSPTYTAPPNTTDSDIGVNLTVSATCDGPDPLSDSDSTTLTVQPVEHALEVLASADPMTVASGGSTSLTANFSDSRSAHIIAAWSWDDGGAGGTFNPSGTVWNPSYTAPENTGETDLLVTLTVTGICNGPGMLSDSDVVNLTVQPVPTYPAPGVLLEVHPNERAPGVGTTQYIGKSPWTQPTNAPAGSYWWKKYEFAAHGPLWVQACAQNWDKTQKGYGDHDDTKLQVNGIAPTDYDGIQSGTGSWQWTGGMESGKRVTLRFLVPCTPGKQVLWIGADESPALWWLKVIDLEPGVLEAF